MHPCLCIDEILRPIAREVVASVGKTGAVALACCCKSFEDPVLDALWETQVDLTLLLETLPWDVWEISGEYRTFKRLPTKLEWARFRGYAQRIRTLVVYHDLVPLEIISVLRPHGEHFLPNLNSLTLRHIREDYIPSIPSLLSPKITSVSLSFAYDVSTATIASVIKALPTSCPNLRIIDLLVRPGDPTVRPRDPIITAVVSEMLLATNRNILQQFYIDSPLTEEANEVIYKLPNLRDLRATVDGLGSLPTFVLPNLTTMDVKYDGHHGWLRGFRGATLGKLTSIVLRSEKISPIDGFLGAFESVALTTSITGTLSEFKNYTPHSWRPEYRSLLPFTQLKELEVRFYCYNNCSSTTDDSIITDLARAMPKLEILSLGSTPCQIPANVTVRGLAVLAYHCPRLSRLCVHFQIASLDPPAIPQVAPRGEPTVPREDCALTNLDVGAIPVSEESALMVALTLLRIFPCLERITYTIRGWKKVADVIDLRRTCRSLETHT